MASILFTLVPVLLTFAVAAINPQKSTGKHWGEDQPCSDCPA